MTSSWTLKGGVRCNACGGTNVYKHTEDYGQGFFRVYTCEDCGYEDIEVAT